MKVPAQAGSGSPAGEPEYLVVGFLRRPHGVRGEIVMDVYTDFPERLKSGKRLYVGEEHVLLQLAAVRPHQNGLLVRFKGVDTPEAAGQFRNQWVYVKTSELPPLPRGQFYQHQLLGLQVEDEQGNRLGVLTEILETGANDVYVVVDEKGGELLLPAIPSVILDVQPEGGFLRVHLLDGLREEPPAEDAAEE
jgi:16S rRNA processing protein RimM